MKAPGRTARQHTLDDLAARSFVSAGIPVTKEPIEWNISKFELMANAPTG